MRFMLISLASTVAFIVLFLSSAWMLGGFELAFRSWVWTTAIALSVILVITFLISCIVSLQRYKQSASLLIRLIGTTVLSASILLLLFFGAFGTIFSTKPEHIVDRNGVKMVAVVTAWLDVDVDYYEHKNWLVHGKKVLISEWYGSGGYDPFTRESVPAPVRIIYYDENGKSIKSIK
ncbi:hypothetical protein [Paenibacillus albus]|uniref:Uncharacterized protein n=1 Tax=Paenibacillus albus TaxID=2495582 RepID=A0A3Q8X7V1_9BACL|nr:hypothetical protein [Paenibacillus albus]AZN42554.1 hypothetical protein EJC50_24845 [Paenibacillus albus]